MFVMKKVLRGDSTIIGVSETIEPLIMEAKHHFEFSKELGHPLLFTQVVDELEFTDEYDECGFYKVGRVAVNCSYVIYKFIPLYSINETGQLVEQNDIPIEYQIND